VKVEDIALLMDKEKMSFLQHCFVMLWFENVHE